MDISNVSTSLPEITFNYKNFYLCVFVGTNYYLDYGSSFYIVDLHVSNIDDNSNKVRSLDLSSLLLTDGFLRATKKK